MTTARRSSRTRARTEVLVPRTRPWMGVALTSTAAVGLVVIGLAVLVGGSPAVLGAGIGLVMVCLFFGVGAVALDGVLRLAPALSLLLALLTYTAKVVLLGLAFLALAGSGALNRSVDGEWLGGAVIACTLAWLTAQVWGTLRARQPIYDLAPRGDEASAS